MDPVEAIGTALDEVFMAEESVFMNANGNIDTIRGAALRITIVRSIRANIINRVKLHAASVDEDTTMFQKGGTT